MSGVINTISLFRPTMRSLSASGLGIEQNLQEKWGDRVQVFKAFNFCAPFLPNQVLREIKAEGFDKLLIYPLLVVDSIFTSGIAVEQVNHALAQMNGSSRALG